MTGVKGKSGGQRDGAGRPPSKVAVRVGQEWVYRVDGGLGLLATVTEIKRNRITIMLDNGEVVTLLR